MKKNKPKKSPDGSMSLSGHLKELRNRIIVVLVVLVVGIVACFTFAPKIVTLLTGMASDFSYTFVYLKPQELLLAEFGLSLIGAVVIGFPVLAYEVYAFLGPGLKKKEKNLFLLAMIFGLMFFCVGVFFAYKVMLPFMLKFLKDFSVDVDVTASISIHEYISFVLQIFLIFGCVFEMPVLTVLMTILGIIKPEWLVKARKAAIVLIFFCAAIITPPDIVSQIMVAFPMILLFELSIVLSKIFYRLRRKKEDDDDDDEDDDD